MLEVETYASTHPTAHGKLGNHTNMKRVYHYLAIGTAKRNKHNWAQLKRGNSTSIFPESPK